MQRSWLQKFQILMGHPPSAVCRGEEKDEY